MRFYHAAAESESQLESAGVGSFDRASVKLPTLFLMD